MESQLISLISIVLQDLTIAAIALTYASIFAKQDKRSIPSLKAARLLFATTIGLLGLMAILRVINFDQRSAIHFIFKLISGIVFILAGISLFIEKKAKAATLLLTAMVAVNILIFVSTGFFDIYWFLWNILPELALAGGALTWAGIFWSKEDQEKLSAKSTLISDLEHVS